MIYIYPMGIVITTFFLSLCQIQLHVLGFVFTNTKLIQYKVNNIVKTTTTKTEFGIRKCQQLEQDTNRLSHFFHQLRGSSDSYANKPGTVSDRKEIKANETTNLPFGYTKIITTATTTTTTTTTTIGESGHRNKSTRKEVQNQRDEILCKVQDAQRIVQQDSASRTNVQLEGEDKKEQVEQLNNIQLLTQEYCDDLFAQCVAYDEWDSVIDVIDIMKYIPGVICQGRSTYKACIQACYDASNAESCNEVLIAMDQAQIYPDIDDIDLAVRTMCRSTTKQRKTQHKYHQNYYHQQQQQHKPNYNNVNNNINQWLDKAVQLVKKHDNLPVTTYDNVLTCLLEERQWQEAVRLLRSMEASSLRSSSYPKKVNDNDTTDSSDETTNKTSPVLSTYRIVIECCVISNQPDVGVQILQSCVQNKFVPAMHTFEIIISALSKKLQWRRSIQLLDLMDELSVLKSIQIYNAIIISCAKAKEIVPAKNLLLRMTNKDKIRPNIISYNSVISACASNNDWKNALAVFDLAHREPGVTPDVYTYTNAIRACAKGGQTRRALTLFQVVKDKKLPLDTYCYTAAIEACSKGGMSERALELLAEMERDKIKPSEVTYSVVITACGNGGLWQKSLELLAVMRTRQIPVNLYVYNAVITSLSKAAKRNTKVGESSSTNDNQQLYPIVMGLLDEMKQDGIKPDGFTYSSAISCCGAEGLWEEALQIIDMMRRGGPRTQPNKVAYTAAITSCGRAGQADCAIRLFDEMKEQGLQIDRVAYNALFSALRVAKKSDAAYRLWDEMVGTRDVSTTTSPTSNNRRIGTLRSLQTTTPDIITVTDAIAAISSDSDGLVARDRVDAVFSDAVRRSIVLRGVNNQLQVEQDSVTSQGDIEVDLSGMSFPVARAACRYVLNRLVPTTLSSKRRRSAHLSFITGVGAGHSKGGESSTSSSLRDYVQEILISDFIPPVKSIVDEQEQSKVKIKAFALRTWIDKQRPTISDPMTP